MFTLIYQTFPKKTNLKTIVFTLFFTNDHILLPPSKPQWYNNDLLKTNVDISRSTLLSRCLQRTISLKHDHSFHLEVQDNLVLYYHTIEYFATGSRKNYYCILKGKTGFKLCYMAIEGKHEESFLSELNAALSAAYDNQSTHLTRSLLIFMTQW